MNNQNTENINVSGAALPKKVEIIGVKFRDAGKVYYFDPGEIKVTPNDRVIVETTRGIEYGFVTCENKEVPSDKIVPPLRSVIRIATDDDTERYETNKRLEAEAFEISARVLN